MATAARIALTTTGVLLLVVVPLPSWHSRLRPQARTWLLGVRARLWPPPPAMAVTEVPFVTAIGVLLLVVVPLPNWPVLLRPQAQAEPGDPVDPAAWVPIGDPEMNVPDSASIAASPSAARARSPWRAPSARGAVVCLVTLSLSFSSCRS